MFPAWVWLGIGIAKPLDMVDLGILSEDEIIGFYKAYYCAFPELTAYTKPIVDSWTENGSRVSFDKDMQPFVGISLGYNLNTPEMRKYLSESILLEKAKLAIEHHLLLYPSPIPGGRYFLATDGIYKKDQFQRAHRIAKWELKISNLAKAEIDQFIYLKTTLEKYRRENEILKRQSNR